MNKTIGIAGIIAALIGGYFIYEKSKEKPIEPVKPIEPTGPSASDIFKMASDNVKKLAAIEKAAFDKLVPILAEYNRRNEVANKTKYYSDILQAGEYTSFYNATLAEYNLAKKNRLEASNKLKQDYGISGLGNTSTLSSTSNLIQLF